MSSPTPRRYRWDIVYLTGLAKLGRGTWYYSLGVFLEIVNVFVRSEFEISSWRGARVDVRTYLLGGAIDSSEANGIIRDPKLKLENSHFTFDLVPLSYESVDVVCLRFMRKRTKEDVRSRRSTKAYESKFSDTLVVCELLEVFLRKRQEVWNDCRSCKARVGSNGNLLLEASVLLGRKVQEDDVAKTVFRMRNGHVEVYGYVFWVNQCTSGFHGVNEPGGVRVAREDDRGVTEGREDVLVMEEFELLVAAQTGKLRLIDVAEEKIHGKEIDLDMLEAEGNDG
ncbi:hypothetical protein Tco_1055357 [Tanacetum coccineum]|uniref:Uncharacterized protein n=1 Tax=Tanacetum coccineum TaxID=301880 RepID=A0ABQ5H0V4_9ASTR